MIGLMLVLVGGASGATLEVPSDYTVVQDAIDAASPGDTVSIGPGTFNGGLLIDKELSLVGAGMNATVLTAGAGDFVLTVDGAAPVSVTGLSISGGDARGCVRALADTTLELESVKLRDGWSDGLSGAAAQFYSASATVSRSIVCENESEGVARAGGFMLTQGGELQVSESVFLSNLTEVDGGAIAIAATATLTNNVFLENEAGDGAALFVLGTGNATFLNNIVMANVAAGDPKLTDYAVSEAGGGLSGSNNLYFDNADGHVEVAMSGDLFDVDPVLSSPAVACEDAVLTDFALLHGSPAIGTGEPAGVFEDIGAVEFVDADGDGYAAGYEDCDDTNPTAFPGGVEVDADGVDQDCDGFETCFVDADDDGDRSYSFASSSNVSCDGPYEALASQPVDCDDSDPLVNSGFPELPCDGIDNDCNAGTPDDDGTCDTGDTGVPTDADTDMDTDSDTDADVDTDTDVDTDADTDADTDVDADVDTDTDVDTSVDATSGVAEDGCACGVRSFPSLGLMSTFGRLRD